MSKFSLILFIGVFEVYVPFEYSNQRHLLKAEGELKMAQDKLLSVESEVKKKRASSIGTKEGASRSLSETNESIKGQ